MYLVEYQLGSYRFRKYIVNDEMLERFINDNPQYEYVKIIDEINEDNVKRKVRRKDDKH